MGLKNFQIVFDNQWTTYYCGQSVTGRILLTVDAPKKIRGIVIHFKGEAATKWEETKRSTNSEGREVDETINYVGQETYFENKYNLVGGAAGEITLQPGQQCYTFNTVLPPNLPSSFEGEFGHVRYTVKVTIDRPWKFDQETKAAFTVISPLDLNTHLTAKDPVKITKEKYFCCCCCKSGPLTLVASLPASGYVSGQQIPVTVEVDNISQEEISNVTVTLRKCLTFTATVPSKTNKNDKIIISEINLGSVGKNGSHTWTEAFPIPPLPPSNLSNCSLIDLEYDLLIEGKISAMCHSNVHIKIPLVFGTIPLTNFLPPAPAGGGSDEKAPLLSGYPTAPPTGGDGWTMPPSVPGQAPGPNNPNPYGLPANPELTYPGMPGNPQGGYGPPTQPPQGMGYPGTAPPYNPAMGGTGVQPNPGMGYPGSAQPAPGFNPSGVEGGNPNMGMQPAPGMGYPGMPPQGYPNNPQPGYPMPSNPLYPSLPPPSFTEAASGPKNIQDAGDSKYVQGNLDFTPKYPTYNFPNPYAPAQ